MSYSTFRLGANDATKSLCSSDNLSTWHVTISKNTWFWKVDWTSIVFLLAAGRSYISSDRIDFNTKLRDHERHIFWAISVIKRYSIQFRDVAQINAAAAYLYSWTGNVGWNMVFSETIHSRSYTHIIRGMVDDRALFLTVLLRMKKSSTERSVLCWIWQALWDDLRAPVVRWEEFERLYVNEYGWEPYPLHRSFSARWCPLMRLRRSVSM